MKRLTSFGWKLSSGFGACAFAVTGVLASASLSVAGCSQTDSLGTENHSKTPDGGQDSGGSGGTPNGTGGRGAGGAATGGTSHSGGTAGGGGGNGSGGVHTTGGSAGIAGAGGTQHSGGASGSGGNEPDGGHMLVTRYLCPGACTGVPTSCPVNQVLIVGDYGSASCCPHCEPRQNLTHPSCIIDGTRYDEGAIVKSEGCASCTCVDGHIGHCTGACPETDAGHSLPPLPLPMCGAEQTSRDVCVECGEADGCTAIEYQCYSMAATCDAAHPCGTGHFCDTGICVTPIVCG